MFCRLITRAAHHQRNQLGILIPGCNRISSTSNTTGNRTLSSWVLNKDTVLSSSSCLQWTSKRFLADLPSHEVLTMPALSPTMEKGNIVSWAKKEGDCVLEGDLLCEIETDKAVVGFEATEEGYLAKILVPAGTKDVKVGKPVCVTVSDKNDVPAFKDFKV